MTTQPSVKSRGKRYRQAAGQVDRRRTYSPREAVETLKGLPTAGFDETVEIHIHTNADPRHADQLIRGVTMLPHGTGKPKKVLAFVQGPAATAALEAGADYIGDDEVIRRIEQEAWTDFDVAVATPDMMGKIGRLGRYLGRRGLMPNPRTGTVVQSEDLPRVIREAKGGRVEFRMDRSGNLHVPIGKLSFPVDALLQNLGAVVESITRARPEGVKGALYKSMHLTSTMGPGIPMSVAEAQAAVVE